MSYDSQCFLLQLIIGNDILSMSIIVLCLTSGIIGIDSRRTNELNKETVLIYLLFDLPRCSIR